jgi:hypothetical protein
MKRCFISEFKSDFLLKGWSYLSAVVLPVNVIKCSSILDCIFKGIPEISQMYDDGTRSRGSGAVLFIWVCWFLNELFIRLWKILTV